MERTITPQQLKALHAWFTRAGWDADERHDFIETMTGGRTRSTRELTMREASDLLKRINTDYEERVKSLMQQEARALLRSIYHLSMQISFDSLRVNNVRCPLAIIGKDDREMNKAKVNQWARNKTKYRKDISRMTVNELRDVKQQLEAIVRKEGKNND